MTLKSSKLQYMNLEDIEKELEEKQELEDKRVEIKKKVNRINKRNFRRSK